MDEVEGFVRIGAAGSSVLADVMLARVVRKAGRQNPEVGAERRSPAREEEVPDFPCLEVTASRVVARAGESPAASSLRTWGPREL